MSTIGQMTADSQQLSLWAETKPPVRIVLFKAGETGIGTFKFDEKAARAVIKEFEARGNEIPIDYHHASERDNAASGTKAKAAGWVRGLEWKDDVGLIGTDIQWTLEAENEILGLEYKYFSPAFDYVKKTGQIVALTSVALTNRPMTAHMTELLRQAAEDRRGIMPKKKSKKTATRLLLAGDWSKDVRDKLSKYVAEEVLPDVEVSTEALPDEEVAALDAVGELIASLASAMGMTADDGAEAVLAAAIEKLGGMEDDSAEKDKEAAEIAKRLGVEKDKIMAELDKIAVKASRSDTLAKQVASLESKINDIHEERETERVNKMLAEQYDAGKLNPNDEKAVAAARDMAKSNPDGFEALFASMEASVPNGKVGGHVAVGKRDSRIKEYLAEFTDNERLIGCSKEKFVDVSLEQAGLGRLTDDEKKRFIA